MEESKSITEIYYARWGRKELIAEIVRLQKENEKVIGERDRALLTLGDMRAHHARIADMLVDEI